MRHDTPGMMRYYGSIKRVKQGPIGLKTGGFFFLSGHYVAAGNVNKALLQGGVGHGFF